jgi:chemotaxis protein CheC
MVLTAEQLESFGELMNLGIKNSITNLSNKTKIIFQAPYTGVINLERLKEELVVSSNKEDYSFRLSISGEFAGIAELVFPLQNKSKLGSLLIGNKYDSILFDSTGSESLGEISNILINNIMGAIANLLSTCFQYKLLPNSNHRILNFLPLETGVNSLVLFCKSRFYLNDIPIECNLFTLLDVKAGKKLKGVLVQKHLSLSEIYK